VWYWGSDRFRKKLMSRVDSKLLGANPNDRSGALGQDRREKDGERIIAAAPRRYRAALNALQAKACEDHRRAAVGSRNDVAAELGRRATRIRTPSNVSRIVGRFSKLPKRSLPKAVRE